MSGTRLDVHRCGGGDTRILLIHGSGSAAKPFLGLAEALIARLSESATDSEAVAVSLAGYGSTPADTHQPIVDQHLQVLREAMDGSCWHLVGHSMGGYLALQLALRLPDQVSSLSLIEPMAFGVLDRQRDQDAIEADQRVISQFAANGVATAEGIRCFIEAWNQSSWESLPGGLRSHLTQLAPLIYEEAAAVSSDQTTLADYGELSQALLLLAGRNSPLPAQRIVERLSELPSATSIQWLDGAGHMSVLQSPERFAASIAAHISQCAQRTPSSE